MSRAIRTALSLVVSLMLFSAVTMAQPGGNNADKNKGKEHHSRLGKIAFWHHHKNADNRAKAQAPAKHARPETSQIKPAPARQVAAYRNQKQEQHASNRSKVAVNRASSTKKTNQQQNSQDPGGVIAP